MMPVNQDNGMYFFWMDSGIRAVLFSLNSDILACKDIVFNEQKKNLRIVNDKVFTLSITSV